MTESDNAILNSVVAEEEEGEGEEGSSAPVSNQHTLGMQQAEPALPSLKLTGGPDPQAYMSHVSWSVVWEWVWTGCAHLACCLCC